MKKFLIKYSNQINGYIFILPAFLIISLFGIFPVFFGMYMSVHKWKVFKGRFLGFENYERILGDISSFWLFILGLLIMIFSYWFWSEFKNKFKSKFLTLIFSIIFLIFSLFIINYSWSSMLESGDKDFLYSLIYIFYYSFFAITSEVGLGLLIAYALYQKLKGKQFFQMILLFPYITPAVMGGAVFFLIFGKAENSLLNEFIGLFGFDPQMWLFDKRKLTEIFFGIKIEGFFAGPSLALTTSILYGIWSYTGYYAIILLAGLSIIPSDLYEAAKVEGASRWQTFIKITVPLLMPIIFFLLLTGFINSFQAFNHILVMKTSSAGETMDVVTIEIFDHFWDRVKFGYAAAEGVVLFIILNVLAISQYVIFRKKLSYD
ncbi:MAG: L-arabinose transport system permease protein AraP [Alphaproteobacteria bacterium MarineAlpha5_Bin5]|nr:MAG: L-arabinose transport system permease protein AraP [Alphaproteobacteria bacterium MarineAlpha5_Bin5]PPR51245.1 MAG: L-arabinose transport system permease protein AraP [Alphaproteobacteria bacterium MarineAlpha5_Bin4]|tara:strand:+ start:827 stop:1951 length:1125 start_codon:yes stop_codon:yes gene_type:complete